MKKLFFQLFIISFLFLPNLALANIDLEKQELEDQGQVFDAQEDVFEAEVIAIQESQEVQQPDGSFLVRQNAVLKGLKDNWQGQEIISQGINDLEVSHNLVVEPGDKVLVSYFQDITGQDHYYVIDIVRRGQLLWLLLFFCFLMVAIGRIKGFKALISLGLSIVVIMYLIVPGILAGYNPLLITIASCFILLIAIIYITWGWQLKSHLGLLSLAISLALTAVLSWLAVEFTKLSGFDSEDVLFLMTSNGQTINFKGLLLAGMVIGALGVLDDVVISQISAIQELKIANSKLTTKELFKRGMRIGTDHISSMTNTLFLAYAGAALPILMLFQLKETAFHGVGQIINSEMMATEIVRTLSGSIGLILAMPIATFVAAKYFKKKLIK